MNRTDGRQTAPDPEDAMAAHYSADAEGRICMCTHLESFHWDYTRDSECGVAGCDCAEYQPDVYEGMKMRARKLDEDNLKEVQDTWAWAARTVEDRRAGNETTWDEAVTQVKGPRPFPDQPRLSRKHDRAVLDALDQLGGNPNDLPA